MSGDPTQPDELDFATVIAQTNARIYAAGMAQTSERICRGISMQIPDPDGTPLIDPKTLGAVGPATVTLINGEHIRRMFREHKPRLNFDCTCGWINAEWRHISRQYPAWVDHVMHKAATTAQELEPAK